MDERMQFVAEVRRAHESMTTLCDRYGISRKTGYKRRRRHVLEVHGLPGERDAEERAGVGLREAPVDRHAITVDQVLLLLSAQVRKRGEHLG